MGSDEGSLGIVADSHFYDNNGTLSVSAVMQLNVTMEGILGATNKEGEVVVTATCTQVMR